MSQLGLGCAKTKTDLVVMPSGRQIFAFFSSERDHKPQNSRCSHTAQRFHTARVKNGVLPYCYHVSFLGGGYSRLYHSGASAVPA
jgi:hypothetical protein